MSNLRRTYIIAEIGVNHNGSIQIAKELIDMAAEAGADAVKFQTFRADKIACQDAPKAEYQLKTTATQETQFEMLKRLEFDKPAHIELVKYCRNKGIQFLSTPFDIESTELLANDFNLPILKISSGDITNGPLLFAAARTGKRIILSTGMSTLGEVETALGIIAYGYTHQSLPASVEIFENAYISEAGQHALRENVVLLHCTTEYPAPFNDVNLHVLDTLRNAFNLPIGISDHTPGIAIAVAGVAMGAQCIEKHVTLDKNLPGPDHKASLEPEEFKLLVQSIRQVESALGNSVKIPASSELKNKPIARKSLVAACPIKKGELFTEANLTVKRPGTGVSPIFYWDWLGRTAERDYERDEQVSK